MKNDEKLEKLNKWLKRDLKKLNSLQEELKIMHKQTLEDIKRNEKVDKELKEIQDRRQKLNLK